MGDNTEVRRTRTLRAEPDAIMPHLVDFRRWVAWSPWEGLDPDLKRTYGGSPSGFGATYAWSGNRKAGSGRMEVIGCDAAAVEIDLVFTAPFRSQSRILFGLLPAAGGTEVVWRMLTPRTLATRVMGIFMNLEKMVGPDLEKGLAQLQRVVESGPAQAGPAQG